MHFLMHFIVHFLHIPSNFFWEFYIPVTGEDFPELLFETFLSDVRSLNKQLITFLFKTIKQTVVPRIRNIDTMTFSNYLLQVSLRFFLSSDFGCLTVNSLIKLAIVMRLGAFLIKNFKKLCIFLVSKIRVKNLNLLKLVKVGFGLEIFLAISGLRN